MLLKKVWNNHMITMHICFKEFHAYFMNKKNMLNFLVMHDIGMECFFKRIHSTQIAIPHL